MIENSDGKGGELSGREKLLQSLQELDQRQPQHTEVLLEDNEEIVRKLKFEGDLEMKDGGIMPTRHAYYVFADFRTTLAAGKTDDLRDLYRIAKGEKIDPARFNKLRKGLQVCSNGTLSPDDQRVLLLSYREDADGTVHLDPPWREDSATNQELIRRLRAKAKVESKELLLGLTRDDDSKTWERN